MGNRKQLFPIPQKDKTPEGGVQQKLPGPCGCGRGSWKSCELGQVQNVSGQRKPTLEEPFSSKMTSTLPKEHKSHLSLSVDVMI